MYKTFHFRSVAFLNYGVPRLQLVGRDLLLLILFYPMKLTQAQYEKQCDIPLESVPILNYQVQLLQLANSASSASSNSGLTCEASSTFPCASVARLPYSFI